MVDRGMWTSRQKLLCSTQIHENKSLTDFDERRALGAAFGQQTLPFVHPEQAGHTLTQRRDVYGICQRVSCYGAGKFFFRSSIHQQQITRHAPQTTSNNRLCPRTWNGAGSAEREHIAVGGTSLTTYRVTSLSSCSFFVNGTNNCRTRTKRASWAGRVLPAACYHVHNLSNEIMGIMGVTVKRTHCRKAGKSQR
jgi:hypothetical protein